jgi:Fic/DOC family
VFESIRPGEIWMAAEAKKQIRKKTAQRSPSRPPAPGKKVAKAGASGAVGKSSVRAVASRPSPVKKAGASKPEARKPGVAKQGHQAGSAARKSAAKAPPSVRVKDKEKAEREKVHAKGTREKDAAKKLAQREKDRLKAEREKALVKAARDKEKDAARLAKEKTHDKQRSLREKQAEQVRLEREKEQARKHALKERAEQQRLKATEANERKLEKDRQKNEREAERQRLLDEKQREKDRLVSEKATLREKQLAEKLDEREALRQEREAEQQRLKVEREAEQQRLKVEREAERNRAKVEREEERLRVKAEREAERDRLREETRQKREEERAKRDAEREAYRKAKEAELNRIRTERAAARRALEGRVARAGRAAGGSRASTTTRVYSPASIPDQSGTRRDGMQQLLGIAPSSAPPPSSADRATPFVHKPRTLPPPPVVEPPATIEERYAKMQARLSQMNEEFRSSYEENFVMSWIHHDSALEGVVYTYEELRTAVNPNITVVPDSSLQSVCEEIRRHKQAIEVVRELGERKRQPATLDQLKRIYLTLHPEEGDLKTVRYRKEIPQHRMYFHEYAAPDKIPYKMRQVFDWLNGPEPKKLKSPLRVAARIHYDILRIFPFGKDSGKVARLFMNMLLLRADFPPAILHSTERQRYYEALKGSPNIISNMVEAAIFNALQSIEKQLGAQDTRLRAIVS